MKSQRLETRQRLVSPLARIAFLWALCASAADVGLSQVTVKSAKLRIQGDDEWRGWLNGNEIGEGKGWNTVFEPAVDPKWFKPCGKNVLAVWFKDTGFGITFLIYRLEVKLSDGSTKIIYSDGDEKMIDMKTGGSNKIWSEIPAPSGWNALGEGFDESLWSGTGQCFSTGSGESMTQMLDFSLPSGYVLAIKPAVVNKDCDVNQRFDSYLTRESFELVPCPGSTPTPTDYCPGWRLNCGSGFHYLDKADKKWEFDRVYDPKKGRPFGREPVKDSDPVNGRRAGDVGGTDDDLLYQTYAEAKGDALRYFFDVPNPGAYRVTLRFAEISTPDRSFNVLAEGVGALETFNIFEAAGNREQVAVDKSFAVEVTDGRLDLEMVRGRGKPILCGIEVICDPGAQTIKPKAAQPTPTPPGPPPTNTPFVAQPTPTIPGPRPTSTPFVAAKPTATLIPQPTKTKQPTATPVPIRDIKVSWKVLGLYYDFQGNGDLGNEVRLAKFKSLEFQPGGDGAKGYQVRYLAEDGKNWNLSQFTRKDPRSGRPATNLVFMRGPSLMQIDFKEIKLVEVLGGNQAFTAGTGEADLKITLWDGTIYGGGAKP